MPLHPKHYPAIKNNIFICRGSSTITSSFTAITFTFSAITAFPLISQFASFSSRRCSEGRTSDEIWFGNVKITKPIHFPIRADQCKYQEEAVGEIAVPQFSFEKFMGNSHRLLKQEVWNSYFYCCLFLVFALISSDREFKPGVNTRWVLTPSLLSKGNRNLHIML